MLPVFHPFTRLIRGHVEGPPLCGPWRGANSAFEPTPRVGEKRYLRWLSFSWEAGESGFGSKADEDGGGL